MRFAPWRHVLEPLTGYLSLCEKLYTGVHSFAEGWNFGPDDSDAKNVEWITKTICDLLGDGVSFEIDKNPHPHEANYLKLDCSKAKTELGWIPKWDIETTLKSIVEWNKSWLKGEDVRSITEKQIDEYFNLKNGLQSKI
jgi:CDP-glucose 4,6-dehydratase